MKLDNFDFNPKEDKELGISDYVIDAFAAPVRGLEGMAHGVYNLGDFLSFDLLPDWDEQRFFGRSQTVPGSLIEGLTQFAVPFGVIGKGISAAGKAARAGQITGVTGKAAKALTKGKKPGKFTDLNLKGYLGAEMASDFVAFDGQEERLANLIQQFPDLQNPITEYLAADPDDNELVGRAKNVLEGALIGLGVGAVAKSVMAGLNAIKTKNVEINKGASREDAVTSAMMKWEDETKDLRFADLPDFGKRKKFIQEPLTTEDVLRNKSLFMWDEGYSIDEISRTLKTSDKEIEDYLIDIGETPKDFIRGRKDSSFQPEVSQENIEAVGINTAIRMWDEGYSTSEIAKTVNLPQKFIEDEFISLGENPADFIKGRKDTGFGRGNLEVAAEKEERIVFSSAIEMWTEGYSVREISKSLNFPEDRLMDELVSMGESPRDFLGRKDRPFSELPAFKERGTSPDLKRRVEELDETLEDFDATVERTPRPFKTYEEEAMMDIIPKGADTLKSRLMKKFPIKGADPQDVADVEKFIDVMGKRLFGDVSLSVTNKIPSAGRYNFGNNLLQIRQSVIDEGGITRTMVHELWHGLSRYLPKTDVTSLTKQFDKARRDYIRSFGVDLEETVDPSTLRTRTIPKELERFLKGKHTSENYRFKDVDEYFAEEMTDAFLKKLDEKDLAPTGTLKRIAQEVAIMFKDMFASLKSKLGIDQRQKIFNDFLKQRNVTKRAEAPLDFGKTFAELPGFKPSDVVDDIIKDADAPTFRVGGKQSLTGMVKTMGKLPEGMYPQELAGLAEQGAEKLLKDSSKMEKMSQEMLDEGVVNELADAMGANGKMMNSLIQQASKDKTTLFRITARMKSLESMLAANGKEILNVAEQYKNKKGKISEDELETIEARLKTLVEQQLHIQASQSGLASGFGRGLKSRQMDVKIGIGPNEIANTKLRQEYLNKRGGMTVDEMVEGIMLAKNGQGDDLWNTLIQMNKVIRGAEGGKLMDMVEEYYKNSIMYGPRTLTVNASGGAMSSALKNFERYVGGWFSSSPDVKRAVVNSVSQGMHMKDLARFVLNAWKSGDHYIGDARSAFVETPGGSVGSITAKNVERLRGKDIESDAVKGFIDFMGKAIRIPNRFNTSVDQMYKFNEYRTRADANLRLKAYELGIRDPKKVAEYVEDSLSALITRSNRNFSTAHLIKEAEQFVQGPFATPAAREKAIADYVQQAQSEALETARRNKLVGEDSRDNDFMALEELARDWVDPNIKSADEIAFSEQLGPTMQKLQGFVSGVPLGFIVAPFIRTPTNILKFSFSRLLAPGEIAYNTAKYLKGGEYAKKIDALQNGKAPALEKTRKSLLEQIKAVKADGSPDLIARAEAWGKLSTGTLFNTALAFSVYHFKDRINGGGPKDFRQRKVWMAAGNMPYSIKVRDTWMSYQRLDPIATIIGVYADMADLLEDGKMHSIDSTAFEKMSSALTLTLTRNATNKSYLAGIDKFFSLIFDPESTSGAKYLGAAAGGFIPNILNQGQSITGDQELKEARDFADVILKRIPGVAMDLKRNPLGEPVVQEYFEGIAGVINPLNPIMWGGEKNDAVLTELARVAHGFSAPSTKLDGLIDLTNFDGPNDRSAYDRWLDLQSKIKINNLTLRQSLTKLINNKEYRSLDPQSFSGLPSPRVAYLQRIIGRYRKAAKMQMLKEFPEIRQEQQKIKSAPTRRNVIELLQQTN